MGRAKQVDLEGWFCEDQMSIEDVLGPATTEPADPPQTQNGAGER